MLKPSALRQEAAERLRQAAYSPKRLVLLHTAVALGCSVLSSLISYVLSLQIAETGGLSGMELRAALSTAQSVLTLLIFVGLPFWQIGLYYTTLQWTKGEQASFSSLLHGFYKFGSVLRLLLWQTGLLIAVGIAVYNVSYIIFTLTPFAAPLMEQLATMQPQAITLEFMSSFTQAFIPLLIIFVALYAVAAFLLYFRLRFAGFALSEGLPAGKAFLKSFAVTRKNCLQILKLDLSYWWYYLLLGFSILISNGDSVLSALDISLPISATAAYFVFYSLGLICQGILLWQCEARRLTAYCLAYRKLAGIPDEPYPVESV